MPARHQRVRRAQLHLPGPPTAGPSPLSAFVALVAFSFRRHWRVRALGWVTAGLLTLMAVAVGLITHVRDGWSFVPDPTTRLMRGDQALLVSARRSREEAERRLRAVSRAGRLASWRGETGDATELD